MNALLQTKIPDGWESCELRSYGTLIGGGTPSRSQPAYWNGSISWASVKDFRDEHVFLYDTEEHISLKGLASSAANLVPENTPVICTRMAVGRCALTTRPTAINQDLKAFLLKTDVDRRFFIRLLRYNGPELEKISVGSTVRGITIGDLLSHKVLRPENSDEQTRIAHVLDTIDEAIAKTEAVISKLKQVRAGMLHDLLSYGLDENGQLRDPIAHPDQFKDSPLGRFPSDWEIKTLGTLCSHIGSGLTPRGGQEVYTKEGILFIRSQNVTFEGLKLGDIVFIPKHIHSSMLRSGVFAHDVLFNITGASIGRCCAMPDGMGQANVNQHVCILRVPAAIKEDALFLSTVLGSSIGQKQLEALNTCGNRQGINYQQLGSFLVPWPQAEERVRIAKHITEISKYLRTEIRELEKFKSFKSGLQDDLLTGRVRVPETIMEEAAGA